MMAEKSRQAKVLQIGAVASFMPLIVASLALSADPSERVDRVPANAALSGIEHSPQLLAQKERRTALVIGNGNYGAGGNLNNPPNDAADIGQALKELGFEVTLLQNANKRQMAEAINQFNRELHQGGVGLFYYAGHGVQVQGENYLVPVEAKIDRESDVAYEGLPLGKVLGAMEDAGNPVNIVLIDACRNNPYSRGWRDSTRGLASLSVSARGMFISFSTSPGKVAADGFGRNSPYTASLLQYIQTPGLDLSSLFQRVRQSVDEKTQGQQLPWDSSSLIGDFAFNPTDVAPLPLPGPRTRYNPIEALPSLLSSSPNTTASMRRKFSSNDALRLSALSLFKLPHDEPSPSLTSKMTGVNYRQLHDLLTAGKWKEADSETDAAMLRAAKLNPTDSFTNEDIERFPCEDLRLIDKLWQSQSKGQFGFGIQGQIYQDIGGTQSSDDKIWEKFGNRVGWIKNGVWALAHTDINWNSTLPKGYLPLLGVGPKGKVDGWESVFFRCGFSQTPNTMTQVWRAKARQIMEPTFGKLDFSTDIISFTSFDLNLRNSIIETTFSNPYDSTTGDWSYGFSFRRLEMKSRFETFDLFVQADSRYFLRKVFNNRREIMATGSISNLNASSNGSNKISVYVNENQALFFVNDKYVNTLDISSIIDSGDVAVVANFKGEGIKGKSTSYKNLLIYSLDNIREMDP
jgi:hypothetical protein